MRFDSALAQGGYAWWYIDAISDDGAHALTCIAFIGSVFSPYYAWANRRVPADPENHCAINVALYGRKKAWSMTERSKRFLLRRDNFLQIGPSTLRWENGNLQASIDEVTVPIPSRLRGKFTLTPTAIQPQTFTLDAVGAHIWHPIAPCARITVTFENPSLTWSGQAYLDHNRGARPLAEDFVSWQWSRATADTETTIFYDTINKNGTQTNLALNFAPDGQTTATEAPPFHHLKPGFWRIPRTARSTTPPTLIATLEDAPFYLRTQLTTTLRGPPRITIHESLNLNRLTTFPIPLMLPFRMPRTN
jgi:carotenoid 1,2-hydratase